MYEDNDVMLPEGWTEGMSSLEELESGQAAGTQEGQQAPEGTGPENGPTAQTQAAEAAAPTTEQQQQAVPAPTTEQGAAPGDVKPEAEAAPTTEQAKAPEKLRFKAKVDRSDVDVELDPAQLPGIYQRAQITERAQQRAAQLQPRVDKAEQLARTLGYRDLDEMVEKAGTRYRESRVEQMVQEGTPKAMAEFIVDQQTRAAAAPPPSAPPAPAQSPARDFAGELRALREVFPDAAKDGRLPDEVVKAVTVEGRSLIGAYATYDAAQRAAESERLRRENEVLRQNSANRAKAPVTGATGGGATGTKATDDFLTGFASYDD